MTTTSTTSSSSPPAAAAAAEAEAEAEVEEVVEAWGARGAGRARPPATRGWVPRAARPVDGGGRREEKGPKDSAGRRMQHATRRSAPRAAAAAAAVDPFVTIVFVGRSVVPSLSFYKPVVENGRACGWGL